MSQTEDPRGSVGNPTDDVHDEGLRGRALLKALALLAAFGVLYVGWKYVKHNWLADHGYLPDGMREYWVVFAAAWVGFIVWAAKTRLRV